MNNVNKKESLLDAVAFYLVYYPIILCFLGAVVGMIIWYVVYQVHDPLVYAFIFFAILIGGRILIWWFP